jgi:hypothetical protein
MTTYREAAECAYQRVLELIGPDSSVFVGPPNGYWHQANTLDTCLQYLVRSRQPDSQNLTANAIKKVFYPRMKEKEKETDPDPLPPVKWGCWSRHFGGPWSDDYGWWGCALYRAYQNRAMLKYNDQFASDIITLAKNCFNALTVAWDDSEAAPNSGIKGGAWNHEELSQALTGRNCVTNEVFWLLSQQLFNLEGGADYKKQSKRSKAFFLAADGEHDQLLFNDKGLVLERFKGMINESPGWYWAGDQGLFIAVCLGSKAIDGVDLSNKANTIAKNVTASMLDSQKVFHDMLSPNPDFNDDYATGKGVFMRSWSMWGDETYRRMNRPDNFKELILKNANAVWNNRPHPNDTTPTKKKYQFGFNWNPNGKPVDNGGEPTFPGGTQTPSDFSMLTVQVCGLAAPSAVFALDNNEVDNQIPAAEQALVR